MNKVIFKRCMLFFVAIFFWFGLSYVDAATLKESTRLCINKSTGEYVGTSSGSSCVYTYLKTLDGTAAYCTQLGKGISKTTYSISSDFSQTSTNALVAGKAIELVKAKGYSSNKEYVYITDLMNYIFKYSGYKDLVSNNSTLKAIYNEAVSAVKEYKVNVTKLSLSSLSVSNINSTSTSGTYISDAITLKNLDANYGGGSGTGTNGDITYKLSASASNASIYICTDAAGKKCSSGSVTISPTSDTNSYTYYVKIVASSGSGSDISGEDVKITLSASNVSVYPTVVRYESNSASQKLMVEGKITRERSNSTSVTLTVPSNTTYLIKIYKTDEYGDALTGSSLSLYRASSSASISTVDDLTSKATKLTDNESSGASTLSYSKTEAEDATTFFNYQYCIVESKAPVGYITTGTPMCLTFSSSSGTKTSCYDENGDSVDSNYCNATYSCSSGELTNSTDGICTSTDSKDATGTATCPSDDYSLSEDKTTCTTTYSVCPSGYNWVDITGVEFSYDDTYKITVGDNTYACSSVVDESTIYSVLNTCSGTVDSSGVCTVTSASSVSYSCDDGYSLSGTTCVKTTETSATCMVDSSEVSNKYCGVTGYTKVTQSGTTVSYTKINSLTSITISKKDATGENEVPGAKLKICTDEPDDDGTCTVATLVQSGTCATYTDVLGDDEYTVNNCVYDSSSGTRTVSLSWTSTDAAMTWEGLATDTTYYLVEEVAPNGYIAAVTTTEFVINTDGSLKVNGTSQDSTTIVINNSLTEMTVSKADIATTGEVSGATLSICESYTDEDGNLGMSVDDDGNCTVVTLYDGTPATWVSGDEPHTITGLGAGTYYLVETISPDGYDTAESIVFVMNTDGTLSDVNGNSLANNKLVMYDEPLETVTTGVVQIVIAVVAAILIAVLAVLYIRNKDKVNGWLRKNFGRLKKSA